MRLALLCLLPLVAASPARAQQAATLSGTVTAADGQPLPGANVFLAQTQRGTTTDAEGRYRLGNVPLGAHRLVASVVGYETAAEDLVLRTPAELRSVDFRLAETEYALGEVTVESTRDARWQRQFERFERRFVGETPNAAETEILNPYVLDFEERRGTLYASAPEPLVIENRALGYRIRYDLTDFEARSDANFFYGEPLFEELEPSSEVEHVRWQANRRKAYAGSPRHLLRSLIAGTTDEQGFRLYLLPPQGPGGGFGSFGGTRRANRFPTSGEEILKRNEEGGHRLEFVGVLEAVYLGEGEDAAFLDREWSRERRAPREAQTSQLRFPIAETAAQLDRFGRELDPRSIVVSGYMAFERFADELPREYGLAESGIPGAADAVEALRETVE
jgi:hypothetical protein